MAYSTPRSAVLTPARERWLTGALTLLVLGVALAAGARTGQAAGRCGAGGARVLAQSAAGRIAFGDKTRQVTLTPTCGPIRAAVRRAGRKARFFLVVEDLRASSQPGAIFDISLAPTTGRGGRRTRMLGTLNFFNAHPAAAGEGRRVSYDVTDALTVLAGRDALPRDIAIAIAPLSTPERSSDASAGAIRLVVQQD